jgi:lon-related putative ATP-dependent protease
MRKSKIIKKELMEELKELDEKSATPIINSKIEKLNLKYAYNPEILDYLSEVEADIIANIDIFIDDSSENDEQYSAFFKRYSVNIMSSNAKEIPVVMENYPEYHNLIGRIEYESKSGTITTDFTMIKPGSLHEANGGYIIIDAYQLLTYSNSWDLLKRCIKNRVIGFDNNKSQLDVIPMVSFKPEGIPLDVKVILIGTPYIYYLLLNNDEEFEELFNIKVNFDNEIENNNVTALKFLGFISNYCCENNLLPVSRAGVDEILKLALRKAENKRYFTSEMNDIANLLKQASGIAAKAGDSFINDTHIKVYKGLLQRRHGYYRDKIMEMYKEGKYIIDVKGYKIGEINALTVIDYTDFAFGKQARITVATYAGKEGVINIEREVSMSGSIHSKGIMILSGYLGDTFGQEMPLSFNASICFEQLYGEVDGDSASAAELIALLSSLASIPIKQNIAITGSINQRGEIQPIGGINEKIEGFYSICKSLGLNGQQGVIMPNANIDELLLDEEVVNAVENKSFHIYAVDNIEECFEILCDNGLRKLSKKNTFEYVKKKVFDKLRKYNNVYNAVMKE